MNLEFLDTEQEIKKQKMKMKDVFLTQNTNEVPHHSFNNEKKDNSGNTDALATPEEVREYIIRQEIKKLESAKKLVDVEKTILCGGVFADGQPRKAISRLGTESASYEYSSGILSTQFFKMSWPHKVVLQKAQYMRKLLMCFSGTTIFATILMLVFQILSGSMFKTPYTVEYSSFISLLLILGAGSGLVFYIEKKGCWGDGYVYMCCKTPNIPKKILDFIKEDGPFYILFEVEKWELKAEKVNMDADLVALRRIDVADQSYWELLDYKKHS